MVVYIYGSILFLYIAHRIKSHPGQDLRITYILFSSYNNSYSDIDIKVHAVKNPRGEWPFAPLPPPLVRAFGRARFRVLGPIGPI